MIGARTAGDRAVSVTAWAILAAISAMLTGLSVLVCLIAALLKPQGES